MSEPPPCADLPPCTEPPPCAILSSDSEPLDDDDDDDDEQVEASGESLEQLANGAAQRLYIGKTPGVQAVTVRWENLSKSIELFLPKILDWLQRHRDNACSLPATAADFLENLQAIFCIRCFYVNRDVIAPRPYCRLCRFKSFFWQNWTTEISIREQLFLQDKTMITAGADVALVEGDVFDGLPLETLDRIFSNLRGDSAENEQQETHEMMDRQRQQQQQALEERTAKVDQTKQSVKLAKSKRDEAMQANEAATNLANEAIMVAIETKKVEEMAKQAKEAARPLEEQAQQAMEAAKEADENSKFAMIGVANAKRAEDDAREKEATIAAELAKVTAQLADIEVDVPIATPMESLAAATNNDAYIQQLVAENARLQRENARLRAISEVDELENARLQLENARLRAISEVDGHEKERLWAHSKYIAFVKDADALHQTYLRLVSEANARTSDASALDSDANALHEKYLRLVSDANARKEKAQWLTVEAEFLDSQARQLAAGAASQTYVSAEIVALYAKDVFTAFRELNSLLFELSNLGNESVRGTFTGSGFTLDTQRFDDKNDSRAVNRAKELIDGPGKICIDDWVEELKDPESDKDLDDFRRYLNDGFRTAKASTEETLKNQTIDQIHSWRKFVGSDNKPKTFYIPAGSVNEVKGWQPLLDAILFEIGMIVEGDHSITFQQKIAGMDRFPNRILDISVNGMSEHLRVVMPYMISCPIEVKPLKRKSQSSTKISDEGYHQIVGLLAKKLHYLLHFGGIGIDGKFNGGVLTLGGFQLISLETVSVGSANPKLELNRSSVMPLFDDATTKHLFHLLDVARKANNRVVKDGDGRDSKSVDSNKGRKKRSPAQGESNMACQVEQCDKNNRDVDGQEKHWDTAGKQAFRAIAHLLLDSLKNQDLFTSKGKLFLTEANGLQMELTKDSYLGAGLLCCVYRLDCSHVVKIPKSYRASPSLQRERKTLMALDQDMTDCIPKLLRLGMVVFEARCERSELECLVIEGLIGKPSWHVLPSDIPVLEAIYWNVRTALLSAHKKEIIHLDIRPSNIIYDVNKETSDIRVQLIDWGCAAETFEAFSGFRGSLPFAHDRLLHGIESKTKIQPEVAMDWASLTYTMATLLNGSEGKAPWWGFYDSNLVQDYLDRRNVLARFLIGESGLSEIVKNNLLSAIPCTTQYSIVEKSAI